MESAKYTIKAARAIQKLYSEKTLKALTVAFKKNVKYHFQNDEHGKTKYFTECLLQHFQPTTASEERSFSMLRKLLAENRNFMDEM